MNSVGRHLRVIGLIVYESLRHPRCLSLIYEDGRIVRRPM